MQRLTQIVAGGREEHGLRTVGGVGLTPCFGVAADFIIQRVERGAQRTQRQHAQNEKYGAAEHEAQHCCDRRLLPQRYCGAADLNFAGANAGVEYRAAYDGARRSRRSAHLCDETAVFS